MATDDKNPKDDTLARAAEILRRAKETGITASATLKDVKKSATDSSENGVFGWLKDCAENIAVLAATVRTVNATFGWLGDKYRQGTEAVKSVPVIGPMVAWPFKAVPNAIYRFCNPHEGESLRQAWVGAVKNAPLRLGNAVMNACRGLTGKEKVPFPEDTRERVRSVPRIGVSVLMSAWALSAVLNVPVVGDSFDYLVAEPPADAFRMAVTAVGNVATGEGFGMTRETLYCGIPTKSVTDDFMEVTCGVKSEDGKFDEGGQTPFISRPGRLMSEAYSWTHGHGPHDPIRVVGAIKPDATKCEVTYYGTRMRIAKWANFKPEILNASCQPAEGKPFPAMP